MIISLLHPSRGRAKKSLETFKAWQAKASGAHVIEHLLSIDNDDPQAERYHRQQYGEHTSIICANNNCVVGATNRAATKSSGSILIMLSDDFECPDKWDFAIAEAFENKKGYVLKTFDGMQRWLVTLAIMDREYYQKQGYFYYPEYKHMFCDTDMTHKAELQGRLIVRNDLLFRHAHYTTKSTQRDEINVRADSTWHQGEAIYLRRVREKFGLQNVDAMKLGSEAAPHLAWIRKKLTERATA